MSSDPKLSVSYILQKPVSDYMYDDILSLNEKTSTANAASLLHRYERDDIIVVDAKNRPIGIVTDEDIIKVVSDTTIYAEDTKLKDIMTFPVFTVESSTTLQDALQLMRDHKIRKLPVVDEDSVIQGLILQSTIANAIRQSTFVHPRFMSPPVKAVLGNLGFVLQFSGFLMMIPAVLAFFLNGIESSSIFFTSVLLLITGFFLNVYGEKAKLNLRQASVLVFSSYFILILYGTIPYIHAAPIGENFIDIFSNSFFSSAAGFTTGGISFYESPEELSTSFTFYRSFSQMVGGMSFIYLVMTAFYSEQKLKVMRGFISGKTLKLKELFGTISIIFFSYVVVIGVLLYFLGQQNIIDNFSLAMSTVATGGFVPSSNILSDIGFQGQLILMGGMIFGALPFTFHYAFFRSHFFTKKLGTEIIVFFGILITAVIGLLVLEPEFKVTDIIFNVISAGTTAGMQHEVFGDFNMYSKLSLTILMLVGGCGFSTAGGIKIYRFLEVLRFGKNITKKERRTKSARNDFLSNVTVILVFPLLIILVAVHLTGLGFSFEDSIIDAAGVITTGGLSSGIITENLDPATKMIMAFLMIFGRVEIIAIVYILVPKLGS